MRIAYFTTDEVNRDLAVRLAKLLGTCLVIVQPRDVTADERFDAVMYDLDFLPLSERRDILSRLMSGQVTCPALVHGYNLEDEQTETLTSHGVAVHRSFSPRIAVWLSGVESGCGRTSVTA